MSQNCFNQLETPSQLSSQASDLVRDCSKTDLKVGDIVRESMTDEIRKIRLTLSLMRRDLTVIAGMVNRKRP
jgi:exosome complex RNA-binding protein Csl4